MQSEGRTDEVVDVVLLHLVQADLQEHVHRGEPRQTHRVHLLLVRLQDELTEGAAAVPVDLQGMSSTGPGGEEKGTE